MKRNRVIAAFLVSPLAGALYLMVLSLVLHNFNLPDNLGLVSVFIFFAIIGYVAELLLGMPLLVLFRRRRLLGLSWFLLGGFVIGIAIWIVILICLFVSFGKPDNRFDSWVTIGVLGCIVPAIINTTAFWFILRPADNNSLHRSAGQRASQLTSSGDA